jgi:hypothetical protein
MSSFYRSDASQSSRYSKSGAGSSASAIARLTDTKQVTQQSAVVGNRARGSALQINGHVADRITNLNLLVPLYCVGSIS